MTEPMRRALAVLGVIVLVTVAGCERRSPEEISALRDRLAQAVDALPLPDGAQVDRAQAQFDEGCVSLRECPSGGRGYATYLVPVQLPDTVRRAASALCAYLIGELENHHLNAVTAWRGAEAAHGHDVNSYRLNGLGARFSERLVLVDRELCQTGSVRSFSVVGADGRFPQHDAELFVEFRESESGVQVDYAAGRAIKGSADPLPVGLPPLTDSQMAYLRGDLGEGPVVAAYPSQDGIEMAMAAVHGNGVKTVSGSVSGRWTVPAAVGKLRFTVRCEQDAEITIEVTDARSGKDRDPDSTATVTCSGAAEDRQLRAFEQVAIEVRYAQPGEEPRPFVVEVEPARN